MCRQSLRVQLSVHEPPVRRHGIRKRFLTACRVLGVERQKTRTIHHGRHTFLSCALAGGRTLAEVCNAAGA